MVPISKVISRLLYRLYFIQKSLPPKNNLSLLTFLAELTEALIQVNKPLTNGD